MMEDRRQRITKAQFRDKNIKLLIVLEISTCDILKCKMDEIILNIIILVVLDCIDS